MSNKIHQLIHELRDNFTKINDVALTEKSNNQRLSEENAVLNNRINELETENKALKELVENFTRQENEQSEKFKLQAQQNTMVSEEYIDELVKEIDYCIGQLKK